MGNPFASSGGNLSGFATDIVAVTKSDTVDEANVFIAIESATGGAISFVSAKGNARTYTLRAGVPLACGVQRVNATGTSLTDIVGFLA
jgi:NADH:ubiquinone oxidoreductase subunit D|tara:strand:- start:498 stop:761 length:264 start_codon:yes stop_codon:yes gene_type:complete